MALSVASEMIARHEQDKKLEAIQRSVTATEEHLHGELVAKLSTAEQALEGATAALLDHISIPQSVGFASAMTGLSDVKNQAVKWLGLWESRLQAYPDATSLDFDEAKQLLDVGLGGYKAFAANVQILYRAIALSARSDVVGGVEAALQNPGQTLDHIEEHIQKRLAENSRLQERLKELLLCLTEVPITVGTMSWPSTEDAAVSLDRTIGLLAGAISRSVDAPAVLDASGRPVLELIRSADGTTRIVAPIAQRRSG
jgi:hypothetical protein